MAGADFADPEIRESRFKGPGAEKALDLWRRLAQAKATPTTAIVESLANGLAAMEVAGPWKIGSYRRNFKEFYETKMGIAPLPPPTANDKPVTVYGGWGFALNAKSPHIKKAGEFVAWIFSDPNRGVRWTTQGRTCLAPQKSIRDTSAHKSFWEDPKHKTFLEVMSFARAEAANPEEINKIIQDAIQKAFTGQGTIPEIVAEADRRITDYIKTQRK
jgi:multiple sugar transport system substrate-binding protein